MLQCPNKDQVTTPPPAAPSSVPPQCLHQPHPLWAKPSGSLVTRWAGPVAPTPIPPFFLEPWWNSHLRMLPAWARIKTVLALEYGLSTLYYFYFIFLSLGLYLKKFNLTRIFFPKNISLSEILNPTTISPGSGSQISLDMRVTWEIR